MVGFHAGLIHWEKVTCSWHARVHPPFQGAALLHPQSSFIYLTLFQIDNPSLKHLPLHC